MQMKITSKGQVTLPKSIRERLGIGQGDSLEVRVSGNAIIAVPAGARGEVFRLRGFVKTCHHASDSEIHSAKESMLKRKFPAK